MTAVIYCTHTYMYIYIEGKKKHDDVFVSNNVRLFARLARSFVGSFVYSRSIFSIRTAFSGVFAYTRAYKLDSCANQPLFSSCSRVEFVVSFHLGKAPTNANVYNHVKS